MEHDRAIKHHPSTFDLNYSNVLQEEACLIMLSQGLVLKIWLDIAYKR